MRMEEQIARRARRERIQHGLTITLFRLTIRNTGLAFAPEAVLAKRLELNTAKSRNPTYRLRQAVRRLNVKGLVTWRRGPTGWAVRLTEKGFAHAKKLDAAEHIHVPCPKKWDGRWRMVIFDVWESRRAMRNKLRAALRKTGFLHVQHSVWIYPYDCEDLVAFLRAELRLGGGLLYIVAEGIERDEKYRRQFNLP